MPKFPLRARVKVDGLEYTVEQIAEEPKQETRYWLQKGTDFDQRRWVRESKIDATPGDLAAQFARERPSYNLPAPPSQLHGLGHGRAPERITDLVGVPSLFEN